MDIDIQLLSYLERSRTGGGGGVAWTHLTTRLRFTKAIMTKSFQFLQRSSMQIQFCLQNRIFLIIWLNK